MSDGMTHANREGFYGNKPKRKTRTKTTKETRAELAGLRDTIREAATDCEMLAKNEVVGWAEARTWRSVARTLRAALAPDQP